ncbi:MAG: rod shape-determining protein RodA [Phycisphaerae bacterium]|nr:rod shape-determining protein RodA [Phycisphaerae bacterium]
MTRGTLDLTQPGWVVATAVAILCLVGVLCIYATDAGEEDVPWNTIKQGIYLAASAIAALVVLRIGYHNIARHAFLIFVVVLLMLLLLAAAKVLSFDFGGLVPAKRNAYRWILLPGFQLQPSEFMKIASILALAWYLRFRRNYRSFFGMLLPFIILAIPMGLILMEPDLGTTLLMIPVPFVMLFMAGAKKRHLSVVLLAGVVCTPVVWAKMQPYQRMRIVGVFLQLDSLRSRVIANPEEYDHLCTKRQALEWEADSGMQLVGSKAALGSGGLFGQGWGHGTYVKYDFLPDRHNDMVFALVGHQWGLAGCVLVLACYVAIVVCGIEVAAESPDPLGRLVAVGVVTVVAAQVIINVGMTQGLMPITGMTLPFVSYGGSSLLTNFVGVALLISVSQKRPFLLYNKSFESAIEDQE